MNILGAGLKELLIYLTVAIFLISCTASTQQLRKISIGYTKDQVVQEMGEPTVARGAIVNKYGQAVEVWEYKLALPSDDNAGTIIGKTALTLITFGIGAAAFKGQRKNYWLYFIDNKLVQWGEAGDWGREADRIYEVRFNTEPSLAK